MVAAVYVSSSGGWGGAVGRIVGSGFASVLTSGGGKSAEEGRERVRELQEKYGGGRVVLSWAVEFGVGMWWI